MITRRTYFKALTILTAFFVFGTYICTEVLAHGGVEKLAGNVDVQLLQDPISPLVGEKVKLFFNLKDLSIKVQKDLSEQELKNWPVTLTLIDTSLGNPKGDRVILQNNTKTDVNGNLSFDYIFDKENYFDVELKFKDSHGQDQTTGFLIQPRNAVENGSSNQMAILLSGFTLGTLATISIFLAYRKVRK